MKIHFILTDKTEKVVEAQPGSTLLEVIQDNDLPVMGMCGGAGVCGSCRVKIDPESQSKIPPADDPELDLLDTFQADNDVRLACQIVLPSGCDHLRVILL